MSGTVKALQRRPTRRADDGGDDDDDDVVKEEEEDDDDESRMRLNIMTLRATVGVPSGGVYCALRTQHWALTQSMSGVGSHVGPALTKSS